MYHKLIYTLLKHLYQLVYVSIMVTISLRDLEIFLTVVSSGNFAEASRRLNVGPMTITRVIASLEQRLQCRLFHRTTRSGSLTPEGEALLPYVRSMMDMWESAQADVTPEHNVVTGKLRVTSTNVFGRSVMIPILRELQKKHPRVDVELICTDEHLDIVNNGIDVAVRFTHPKDSSLVGKRLSDNPRYIYCSPEYLKDYDPPKKLQDLGKHRVIRASSMSRWPFMIDQNLIQVSVPDNFACNNAEAVKEACIQGMGLALLSHWDVQKEVETGLLVPVILEDAIPQNLPIWILYPTSKLVPARVRAFIELLTQRIH